MTLAWADDRAVGGTSLSPMDRYVSAESCSRG